MDYMQPINGVSLELYADIGAEITDFVNDKERVYGCVVARGISRSDWDAAVAGWTARMQDPMLMGAVATAYMPMYQAALSRRAQSGQGKAAPQATFQDYVAMSGAAKAMGINGMLAHYGLDQGQWTQIAMHWNQTIPTNPQYMSYGMQVEAEGARIGSGGAPKPVSFGGGGGGAPASQPAQAQAAPAQPAAPPAGGGGISAGADVLVQWADGNRYPGRVQQVAQGQYLIGFENGSQQWVGAPYVSKA